MNSWDPLEFLIGNWSSPVSRQPGTGISGSATFSFDLDKNVIIRRSRAEFAPEPGEEKGLAMIVCDLPLFFVPDVKLVPQTIDHGVGWIVRPFVLLPGLVVCTPTSCVV